MQKPVYCLPEPSFMPSTSPGEAGEGQQENGTNDAALWAKNTGGPSSKLNGAQGKLNIGSAPKNIPS